MWVGLKYCQRSKVTVWDERFSDYSRNLSLFLESWESKYIKLDNHKCSQGLEVPASNNFFYNQDVIICSWKACFLLNKMNIVLLGRFQRGTFFDGLSVFQPATWILFYVFHLKVGKLNLCGKIVAAFFFQQLKSIKNTFHIIWLGLLVGDILSLLSWIGRRRMLRPNLFWDWDCIRTARHCLCLCLCLSSLHLSLQKLDTSSKFVQR